MLKKTSKKVVIKKLAQFSGKKALGVLIFGQGNDLVIMERYFDDWGGALVMGVRLS